MKTRKRVQKGMVYLVLSIGVVFILIPLYLTLITAFKTPKESHQAFFSFPQNFNFDNFKTVLNGDFLVFFKNSVVITACSVAGGITLTPLTAYIIQRNINNWYYKIFYMLFIAGILVPFQVFMLPVSQQMYSMHLLNQLGIIILYITFGMCQGIFLYTGYIRTSIPRDMEEAATIDGAGIIRTYTRVIFPMMKPITGTVIIMNAMWAWNDFLLPLLILNRKKEYWTIILFQNNFVSVYNANYNLAFATLVLSILPMVIVYAVFQKNIIAGMMGGAVKT